MGIIDLQERILRSRQKRAIIEMKVEKEELRVEINPLHIVEFLEFLRNDNKCLFRTLADLCAVDYPHLTKRFEVVYNLLSLDHNLRIRVKIKVKEGELVHSVSSIFSSAGWYEREIWDLYGVGFKGHNDLRRILTDYGFDGHPLRKDFPLTGYTEVRYDVATKKVIYEPVELMQNFRNFDFLSPWEGPNYVLPGDEKAKQQ